MENAFKAANIENADDFDVSDFLYKFVKGWPIFIILGIVSLSCAFVYLKVKEPVYEISATLLLKDEKKGLDESSLMESLDLFSTKKIVENEIVVLKSRDLLKEVVKSLRLYAPVYKEGRIKDVSAYLRSPVLVEVRHPDSLVEAAKVPYSYNSTTRRVQLNNRETALNEWIAFGTDTIRFVTNPNYRQRSADKDLYFSLLNVKAVTASLDAGINIASPSKQSTIVTLAYKDEISKRGEDILNELIKTYNHAALEDKNALASNTLAFVEDRLRYVVAELDSVETAMQQFKSNKGIVDISEQGRLFLGNVEDNDRKVSEINMQLAVMDQVEKYVLSKNEKMAIVPSTLGVNDPVLLQLLEKLYEYEMQYERLKKTTAENNYMMASLRDQIEKVKPNILENIRNQRNNLLAGRGTLSLNNGKYTSMLKAMPQQEKELLEISRQQSIKNNIYTYLLQKREETALSFASTVADSRVVERAEAGLVPVSPKKQMILGGALAAAMALSIVIIIIKDLLNKNVEFRSDIEQALSWPVIGEIAADNSNTSIVVAEGVRNVIAEQFRQVRSALDYLGVNEEKKRILITSSVSQEGKSFVAANLGISLALTGKKVLLLEFDLRKPRLSAMFDIDSENGISKFLIGKCSVEEMIKTTTAHPNLYFIPSGPIPPNPSELLLSPRMNDLFGHLEQNFDYILIDSAPIVPVTDADILSKFSDATLFIIRDGYTPKAQVRRLESMSKVRGLKNIAVIFNGTKQRGFNGRYGYADSYGYGYAYSKNDGVNGPKPKQFLPSLFK